MVDVLPRTSDEKIHLYPESLAKAGLLYSYEADPASALYPLALISPASEKTDQFDVRPVAAQRRAAPDPSR